MIRTGIRFLLTVDDLEQGGHGTRVVTDKYDLVILLHEEVHVLEQYLSVDTLRQSFHFKDLVARFAVRREQDSRIAA